MNRIRYISVLVVCLAVHVTAGDNPKTNWPSLKLKHLVGHQSDTNWPTLKIKGDSLHLPVVEAGDIITMQRDGVQYRWKVLSVDKKGVRFQKLDVTPTTNNLDNAEQSVREASQR